MNSHQKRKVKRAHLKVQRKATIGAKREQERAGATIEPAKEQTK